MTIDKTAELQVTMKTTLITILSIILLTGAFVAGWKAYPKFRPCPEVNI